MQPSLVKSLFASKANINFTHISMSQDSPDIVELPGHWCSICGVSSAMVHDETLGNL